MTGCQVWFFGDHLCAGGGGRYSGSLAALQEILWHLSIATTQRYARISHALVKRKAERTFQLRATSLGAGFEYIALVEAAGVEPASERGFMQGATCVSYHLNLASSASGRRDAFNASL